MYDYHHGNLPDVFKMYFTHVSLTHKYNTRFASKQNYALPYVKTNYGKFNLRFVGATLWNSINENLKIVEKAQFKNKLFSNLIKSYSQ